ncbi:rhodanese [Roseivivax halodurans JCM 10272]|uniref:Rhodanese n=1 Tax=Roseivivax halodurans JCM 10272 TaxID=1449350 RepID=X7EAX9_9RHOB|nr:PQQ-dependent catabolism-associated CXXCW motif protein [Roseivivax halodurans]ETX13010.1 rhodanese [Roseivivax halodurans JCM 10272]
MRGRALAVLLAVALPTGAFAQVAEPDSYRMEEYRAPVPETLQGATVVGVDEAYDLWRDGETVFVDVLPRPPKPENLPEGTIWREKPRLSIPGAAWLPNTGYGDIAPATEAYFTDALETLTEGDRTHPVLFFCLPECWMSWNAAKRAIERGYSSVYWFPEGSDGWSSAGHPTEEIPAMPGEPAAE